MDNVCHTLVGAACARAGFARPVRFGAVTSILAANLPDLDVLVFATDVPSVAFRRGWTHGIAAQALLPALLAVSVAAIARRRRLPSGSGASELRPLLALSYVGVLSHVFLDYLNNYGVRPLMPFSGRWFYGDAVFIVDPWLWIAFALAFVAGRRGRVRGCRLWLAIAGIYILAMLISAQAARRAVANQWKERHGAPPAALMVGPVPIDPLRKWVIVDAGDHYRTGSFRWLPCRLQIDPTPIAKNEWHPAVSPARHHRQVAGILVWARFPFWEVSRAGGGQWRVTVRDVRFASRARGGFRATALVLIPPP